MVQLETGQEIQWVPSSQESGYQSQTWAQFSTIHFASCIPLAGKSLRAWWVVEMFCDSVGVIVTKVVHLSKLFKQYTLNGCFILCELYLSKVALKRKKKCGQISLSEWQNNNIYLIGKM